MKKISVFFLVFLIFLVAACSSSTITRSCPAGFELEQGNCVLQESDSTCNDSLCTKHVKIVCDTPSCDQNSNLLRSYATMQSSVVSCLSDYFNFEPRQIEYLISIQDDQPCSQPQGCCCREGGLTSLRQVRSSLNGFVEFEQNHPISSSHLLADEHETTHALLFDMLGDHPLWFSEAIAIQTNERVQCDLRSMLEGTRVYEHALAGDSYLRETAVDQNTRGGVIMSNGDVLNEEYYQRLKQGRVVFSQSEQQNTHVVGALWIIGLKEDYGCDSQCVAKIVQEMHKKVQDICASEGRCVTDQQFPRIITNQDILEATNLVTNNDTGSLFRILQI